MKKLFLLLSVALLIFSVGCPPIDPTSGSNGKAGTGDPIDGSYKSHACIVNGKEINLATDTIGLSEEIKDSETNAVIGYEPVMLNVAFKHALEDNYKKSESKHVKFLIDFFVKSHTAEDPNAIKPLKEQNGHSVEIISDAKYKEFPLELINKAYIDGDGFGMLDIDYQSIDEDKILTARGRKFSVSFPKNSKKEFTLVAKISAVKCNVTGEVTDSETYKVMDDITLNFDLNPPAPQGE